MNIAFVYGLWSIGNRPFDLSRLWEDPRGLTGSELSFFCLAREMALRGHIVSIFTRHVNSSHGVWEGCDVFDIERLPQLGGGYDAVCSWNEPDLLRQVGDKPIRLVNQQLNDFSYCAPGFDDYVDVYTSPSEAHCEYIKYHTPDQSKWEVLSNGCDPSQYVGLAEKVPGRVIYASSPDRGLHLLLQEWPKIRKAVPHAHLRVFYNFEPWFQRMKGETSSPAPDIRECSYRALYIQEAMRRLKNHGVEHCHSVSRVQMAHEMAEAEVLAYPCDTIRYTEGFSVTLMEACAAGVLPVTSSVDSLGGIYGGVVPMVQAPAHERMDEFVRLVVRGLTDKKWRDSTVKKTMKFSNKFRWTVLAGNLEKILKRKVRG